MSKELDRAMTMPEPEREVVELRNEHGEVLEYETVASRMARFRRQYPDHALLSEVIKDDGDSIAFKAKIGFYLPTGAFVLLAEGHSETFRNDRSVINRTATMEVTETSAWGRALAAFGFASANSLATADEIAKAKDREADLKEQDKREPGMLVVLQNAAKQGTKELKRVWEQELTNPDRKACGKYMAKLKATAEKSDGKAETEAGRANASGVHRNAPERGELD